MGWGLGQNRSYKEQFFPGLNSPVKMEWLGSRTGLSIPLIIVGVQARLNTYHTSYSWYDEHCPKGDLPHYRRIFKCLYLAVDTWSVQPLDYYFSTRTSLTVSHTKQPLWSFRGPKIKLKLAIVLKQLATLLQFRSTRRDDSFKLNCYDQLVWNINRNRWEEYSLNIWDNKERVKWLLHKRHFKDLPEKQA